MVFCDRRVVIILEIDVIKHAQEVAGRIGDPTPYTESKTLRHLLCFCTDWKSIPKKVQLLSLEFDSVKSSLQIKVKHHRWHQILTPALPYSPRTEIKVSDCVNYNTNSCYFLL